MPEYYYYTIPPTSEHEERHFTSVFMGGKRWRLRRTGVFSKQHIDPGSGASQKPRRPELHRARCSIWAAVGAR